MDKRQQRIFEIRADEDSKPTKIIGYASVFNQIAHGEVIRPGAFTKTLQEQRDIKAFWSHDSGKPLARTTNGTLQLEQDSHGLKVTITPNLETSYGRDALESVARGDVDQMSFGMEIVNATRETIDGESVDVIREVKLYEVSPVAMPWYPGTSAQARETKTENSSREVAPGPLPAEHPTHDRTADLLHSQIECHLTEIEAIEGDI